MTKRERCTRYLLLITAIAVLLWTPVAHAASNDADAVRNAVNEFPGTWNRHDMDAFGKIFAPDADFVNVGGAHWMGRQKIQTSHAWSHGAIPEDSLPGADPRYYGIFRHSTITFNHIDVRFLRKDVAVAIVNWELTGDSRTQNARRGVLTFVLTRQHQRWLVALGHNTEINRTVN
ncbi:MAG TPA: SgcJ/EcaC family oxidoreductase [Terracidiphilus sp.]|nr:SgcJ/EcaC family oxidoreductase [Terracidiphilus sp.]